jgi:hypothetical protein
MQERVQKQEDEEDEEEEEGGGGEGWPASVAAANLIRWWRNITGFTS